MNRVRPALCLLAFFFLNVQGYSQTDSCSIKISLLTCGPGEDLYSIFGHTAIRIKDRNSGMDVVYNYGTFDDSDPYFYYKFTRGIMRYSLSVESFTDFMQEYIDEHRSVTEQTLSLSCGDKQKLIDVLRQNALEYNRYYNYHFYLDNCTTRAKNIIANNSDSLIIFRNILPAIHPSFRQLINGYLDKSGKYWDEFGINIFLGSHLDEPATNEQSMFLPDYLLKGFDSAVYGHRPLVNAKREILAASVNNQPAKPQIRPLDFFGAWFLLVIILGWIRKPWSVTTLRVLDFIFFLSIGFLGIIMLCLWLGRVDAVCRNNLNLLWALPTHCAIAFFMKRQRSWVRNYFRINALISIILMLGVIWRWWSQEIIPPVSFILLISILRSLSIVYRNKDGKKITIPGRKSLLQGSGQR